jgi:hypothetical protein
MKAKWDREREREKRHKGRNRVRRDKREGESTTSITAKDKRGFIDVNVINILY